MEQNPLTFLGLCYTPARSQPVRAVVPCVFDAEPHLRIVRDQVTGPVVLRIALLARKSLFDDLDRVPAV